MQFSCFETEKPMIDNCFQPKLSTIRQIFDRVSVLLLTNHRTADQSNVKSLVERIWVTIFGITAYTRET